MRVCVPYIVTNRSKTAATLGSVIFFAAFFPYYYVGGEAQTEVSTKTWASLLAPTCLALGSDTFAAFEGGAYIRANFFFPSHFGLGTGLCECVCVLSFYLCRMRCMLAPCDSHVGLVGVQVSNTNQSYEGRLPCVNTVLVMLVDSVLFFYRIFG